MIYKIGSASKPFVAGGALGELRNPLGNKILSAVMVDVHLSSYLYGFQQVSHLEKFPCPVIHSTKRKVLDQWSY